jgi:hypothetical protein
MNGKFLLDTNAIIALMSGNYNVLQLVNSANWIGISVISEIEFLSFSRISERDKNLFQKFKGRIEVINLQSSNQELITKICEIRLKYKLKLPDATIAASALLFDATMISNDKVFTEIDITVQSF